MRNWRCLCYGLAAGWHETLRSRLGLFLSVVILAVFSLGTVYFLALKNDLLDRLADSIVRDPSSREMAIWYDRMFKPLPGVFPVPHDTSAYHLYQVRIHDAALSRGDLRAALKDRGIGTQVHYRPISSEPWWDGEHFPNADAFASQVLALPLYTTLTGPMRRFVVDIMYELLT